MDILKQIDTLVRLKKTEIDMDLLSQIRETFHDYQAKIDTLERQMLIDDHTQTFNRSGFRKWGHHFLTHHPDCAGFFIDIDHFKKVNDQYGHSAGDRVIEDVAQILKKCFRPDDIVGRVGGDEFAALVHRVTLRDVNERLKHVEKTLNNQVFTYGEHKISVTVSIGVAIHQPNQTLDELLAAADQQMYIHKHKPSQRA